MNTQWEDFWWNNITGPHAVVSAVADGLLSGKNVLLRVPTDLPWDDAMRTAIHQAFREQSGLEEVAIESLDPAEDGTAHREPGRLILDRFAPSMVSRGYRERSSVTIQDYISAKEVLRNRVVWVKNLTRASAEPWIRFCRGFSARSPEQGLFVLEVRGAAQTAVSGALAAVGFSEYVSENDVRLFNGFVLNGQNSCSDAWEDYIAACAASVCNTDAELSELLIRTTDFRTEPPADGIARLAELPDFARRGEERDSGHVLYHWRTGDMDELTRRVWAAQVQVLFPMIELERVQLVRKYAETMRAALGNAQVFQYGERLREPIELELGTMCWMMATRGADGYYILYIPDEADRDRIRFLHLCRNKLAHVACCSPEEVRGLLG